MTTYRERRLAKAERLHEWAGKRENRAASGFQAAHDATAGIPFGQPILVGHHSERRHRAAVKRSETQMRHAIDDSRTAERMQERADNIERAAEHAIYSDDEDAVERLREKLATLEAAREQKKKRNAAFRKEHRAELKGMTAYERDQAVPHPGYELANLGGNISRTRKRLAHLEREAQAIEAGDRGHGKPMLARYDGQCADCGAAVNRGDSMTYYRRTREVVCAACEKGDT